MSAIELINVWEKYRVKYIGEGKTSWEEFWALEDIGLKVEPGEVLGVIGQNGAGKTTLLKLIAGMLIPDKGKIDVTGRVSVLMELGAGFNPEFTGRENVTLNARTYGLEEEILAEQIEKIVEFADLGRFIDAPIKYYSQGMYMRLAFALAIFVEPDILLIDDILSVGDEEARQKCIKKVFELKQAGKTIILVSHDMDMVGKLCNRVVLLEKGKIIKIGLPQKVTQHYLETVGDRKGVAILEQEKIRAVFNNGKLILSYADEMITKSSGGYTTFFDPSVNSWFSSLNLFWQIKSVLPDKIIAEGKSADNLHMQTWTIRISDEGLKWQIEISGKEVREPHIDLFLAPQYKKWSTIEKEGEYPAFMHKSSWQDLGIGVSYEDFLALDAQEENKVFPVLLFESEGKDNQIRTFNTGYDQEARIIQTFFSHNYTALGMRLYTQEGRLAEYVAAARHKLEMQRKAEEERLRLARTIESGDMRLFVDVDNKAIRLYYKGAEITKGMGLHSPFNSAKKWFHLRDAQWETEKPSDEKIVLRLQYLPLDLSHIWTLTCLDKNNLQIKVEMEVRQPQLINNHDLRLELQDGYINWMTAHEEGNFLRAEYINDLAPTRLKESRVSKIGLTPAKQSPLPQLSFEISAPLDKSIFSIYKHREETAEYTCANYSLIIPKKEALINPGRYTHFEGKITLDKAAAIKEKPELLREIVLSKNNLRFLFERGKWKIYAGNKELTCGLSVYTSLRSSGIWYDSSQALWRIKEQKADRITVVGDWPYIPISQTWKAEFIDEKSFFWTVNMEIYEDIDLEIEQTNIMLGSDYKKWAVSDKIGGEFTDEHTHDYDILPFRFWYGRAGTIMAEAKGFPRVIFKTDKEDAGLKAIVENTDSLYCARLLQYQKSNAVGLAAKKCDYFSGVITIETD